RQPEAVSTGRPYRLRVRSMPGLSTRHGPAVGGRGRSGLAGEAVARGQRPLPRAASGRVAGQTHPALGAGHRAAFGPARAGCHLWSFGAAAFLPADLRRAGAPLRGEPLPSATLRAVLGLYQFRARAGENAKTGRQRGSRGGPTTLGERQSPTCLDGATGEGLPPAAAGSRRLARIGAVAVRTPPPGTPAFLYPGRHPEPGRPRDGRQREENDGGGGRFPPG